MKEGAGPSGGLQGCCEVMQRVPKSTERAGGRACQDTFHHLPAVLAKQGGPSRLEAKNVKPIYKKGWKEDPRN